MQEVIPASLLCFSLQKKGQNRVGEISWGGGCTTMWFADTDNDLIIVFMSQLIKYGETTDRAYYSQVHQAIYGPSPRQPWKKTDDGFPWGTEKPEKWEGL